VGPGLGGLLVGVIAAPVALLIDAASYVCSAVSLIVVNQREPEPKRSSDPVSIRQSIREGLAAVFGHRLLRSLLTQSATFNLFQNALLAVLLIYAVRVLHLSALQLGFVIGSIAAGALAGALCSQRLTRKLGLGRALRLSTFAVGMAPLLLIVPRSSGTSAMAILMASEVIFGFGLVVFNVNTVTLRQIVTPNHLLARMNASYRLVLFGTVPVGSLLGGFLAEVAGLRTAMVVTAVCLMSPIIWTFFAPVYALKTMPEPAAEDAGSEDTVAAASTMAAGSDPEP
jgi:MFS-type transporter involved in bile tolerance (Atg22 family)